LVLVRDIKENDKGGSMVSKAILATFTAGILATGVALADDINPVVGKAGDFVMRQADLERVIAGLSPEVRQKLQDEQEQAALVEQMLVTKTVAEKARQDRFDRKPEVKEQLSMLIDQFLAQEYLRKVVLADVKVPEEELKKYYKEHEKEFVVPELVKARHIFVSVPDDATPEAKAKAKAKAEGIAEELKKGGDFAKIAVEQSEDTDSAAQGGDLGYVSAGKTNSEEFEKAALALKPGEVSPVVTTPFGYHIIKADERHESRVAGFDETKEYIAGKLQPQLERAKAEEFLAKLAKESGLKVMIGKEPAPAAAEKTPAK
jgi:parvulin-like peptidyl-prolyl isomerase